MPRVRKTPKWRCYCFHNYTQDREKYKTEFNPASIFDLDNPDNYCRTCNSYKWRILNAKNTKAP